LLVLVAGCGRFGFGETSAPPVDAACVTSGFVDNDGDGFGTTPLDLPPGECAPAGAATVGGDCDDADATVNPAALDACDRDRNCDGALVVLVPEGCASVQAVIDASVASGTPATAMLGAGVHVEDVHWKGAAVMVVGAGAGTTTLQGTGAALPVAMFDAGETSAAGLRALTVTGGSCAPMPASPSGTQCFGAGISIDSASPTLDSVEVANNAASPGVTYPFGGGVSIRFSAATLVDVYIHDNSVNYYGAGLFVSQSNGATFTRLRVVHNTGATYGGGIAMLSTVNRIDGLILAGNQALDGGALMIEGASETLANVTAFGNTGGTGCGAHVILSGSLVLVNATFSGAPAGCNGGALNVDGTSAATITYSNFFANGSTPFTGLSPPSGTGDLAVDPQLADTSASDSNQWDLHLASPSPLHHAGDPAIANRDSSRSDIGAYGGPKSF
jgi:hypothetical protein